MALLMLFTPGAWSATPDKEIDKSPDGVPYVAGELLVTYKADVSKEEADAVAQDAGARTEEKFPAAETRLLAIPDIKNEQTQTARVQDLEREKQLIEEKPVVETVDYNYLVKPNSAPNDPGFANQYGLQKIQAPKAWDYSRGAGTKVAVVDTGVDDSHPDLRGKIAAQKDFVDDDPIAEDDSTGHGTHVAGIAAAKTNNRIGVAGACPNCKLLVAKIVGPDGTGTVADEISGIMWAADNGAKVINLSLGHQGEVAAEESAVEYAWNKGAVVVGAAGNGAPNERSYPAAYTRAIAVSATNRNDQRAGFSNYGDWVDVAAPGVRIFSTAPKEYVPKGYSYKSGTSMSAPYVSGLAALISAQGYPVARVRNRIEATATDLGPRGEDPFFGHGRIDAYKAVYKPRAKTANKPKKSETSASKKTVSSKKAKPVGHHRTTRQVSKASNLTKFRTKIRGKNGYEVRARFHSHSILSNRIHTLTRTDSREINTVNQRSRFVW